MEIQKLEAYSVVLGEKISNEIYKDTNRISGNDILKLTPIEQVNLFVVKNLFDKWKDEMAGLKSPYFNYDITEVKEALSVLGNKLSRNISVKKEHFVPLLQKSISDTLILMLYPQEFFSREFSRKDAIHLPEIQESEKYYKINRHFVLAIINEFKSSGKEEFRKEELGNFLNKVYYNNHLPGDDVQRHIDSFAELLKFEFNEPVKKQSVNIPEKEEVKQLGKQSENKILNEKFGIDQSTLNDYLKQGKAETLADKIGKRKIENLKGSFSLNQKFLFINSLFKGAGTEFENAINDVEGTGTYEEALNTLKQNYAGKYNWNFQQDDVKEFLDIVERKFLN
ncbi:MAG: hypothetical protein K2X86_07850 [Cytophagaceae bacterium]|nr:hypothetical protein [Cytophagaceae bacterium]